ncbi:flavin-containing amine oxidoreductase-domain containing protein [Pavlovales sp. CCMP2436]|nr:flavin-containing amine oxidoreductase-domain containing protein [Pavlovales sp. CCMP2436]
MGAGSCAAGPYPNQPVSACGCAASGLAAQPAQPPPPLPAADEWAHPTTPSRAEEHTPLTHAPLPPAPDPASAPPSPPPPSPPPPSPPPAAPLVPAEEGHTEGELQGMEGIEGILNTDAGQGAGEEGVAKEEEEEPQEEEDIEEGDEVLTADAVVVTLPLGVLKARKVFFEPPLPFKKMDAIKRLGFGTLNKVWLRFDSAFWAEKEGGSDYFGFLPPVGREHGCCYLFWNLHRIDPAQPALLALLAGKAAVVGGRAKGSAPKCVCKGEGCDGGCSGREQAVEVAMDALRGIFGAAVPAPLAVHVTAWETDPFAMGTYSHIAVGATPADYDTLAEPHGRVHFAGEATCATHPATASGAYLSGLRAAGEVLCAATPRDPDDGEEVAEDGAAPKPDVGAAARARRQRKKGGGGERRRSEPAANPVNVAAQAAGEHLLDMIN